jgi:uncharacterized MAPEG superfamily protein
MFIILKGTDGREMQVNTRHVTKVMPIGKSNLTWVFLSDGTKEKIKETYEKVSKQIVNADHWPWFELRILALSVVLGLVQIVLASHAASLQRGYLWTAGSRDEAVPPLTGIAGRLERALRNFVETFPLFAAAVLIAHVTNTHSWMTEWGVQLYFGARVAYLALYAAGVFLLRSLVWNVATLGIAMVLLSLVLNDASAVEVGILQSIGPVVE